ncbi:MAG: hypothetical protein ACQEWV_15685 [Bacillota bacterium]
MQAKHLTGGQEPELLCINTTKVYDWIVNEATFDITLVDEPFDPIGEELLTCDEIIGGTGAVTCEVAPTDPLIPIEVISREDRPFIIDGTELTLQVVTIRKNFTITFFIPTVGGIVELPFDFSRCEQVVLCAPEGTNIEVTFTDLDCFICTFECDLEDDTFDANVTVRLCQSIQSTFPVTLEIVAEFCQPRDILPIVCPPRTMPPQCPVLFPVDNGDMED